jgi:hypothetical protein
LLQEQKGQFSSWCSPMLEFQISVIRDGVRETTRSDDLVRETTRSDDLGRLFPSRDRGRL